MSIPLPPPLFNKPLSSSQYNYLQCIIDNNKLSYDEESLLLIPFWKQESFFSFYSSPGRNLNHNSFIGNDYLSCKIMITKESLSSLKVESISSIIHFPLETYFSSDIFNKGGRNLLVDCARNMKKNFKHNSIFITKSYSLPSSNILFYTYNENIGFKYIDYYNKLFEITFNEKQHYFALSGCISNYKKEASILIPFIIDKLRDYSWSIEKIIICVDTNEQEEYYNNILHNYNKQYNRIHNELPKLEIPKISTHLGPNKNSNWVIRYRLLAGAFPGHQQINNHKKHVKEILNIGVTTFVCLQTTKELIRFTNYKETAKELSLTPNNLYFIHFPIPDQSTVSDNELMRLIIDLAWRLYYTNEIIYIHCWGGHGRTGTVIGTLLGKLYNLSGEEALHNTSKYHKMRIPVKSRSPQTIHQHDQLLFEETISLKKAFGRTKKRNIKLFRIRKYEKCEDI